MMRRPPRSTLLPSTTLFRSGVRRGTTELNHVWSITDNAVEILTKLGQDISDDELERRRTSAGPGDLATLIYTSGTTGDRKSTRLNSSHANISYAVFCLKKNN